ncbi:MAG: hypothetical protein H7A21_18630 [Spirochaetales bacterium]|nr:hypothetical protein [Leptospiraceae bacterium]MCP5483459.1 hypothetical protein [Spirochaetales bacterium]MCP5486554.1 hypothetical protein [Spirochaetales bacterium]
MISFARVRGNGHYYLDGTKYVPAQEYLSIEEWMDAPYPAPMYAPRESTERDEADDA